MHLVSVATAVRDRVTESLRHRWPGADLPRSDVAVVRPFVAVEMAPAASASCHLVEREVIELECGRTPAEA